MADYKVLVTTCNKAMWAMRPMAYLFNIYWSEQQQVDVLCESVPEFELPDNFNCIPVNLQDVDGWPKEKWTNGIVKYLDGISEQLVIWLLDDYWLNRTVDIRGVGSLIQYMHDNPTVLRMDLTKDRLYAGGMQDYASYGHYDLICAEHSQYQMSLQTAIWNKGLLLTVLWPDWDPWQIELQGTSVVNARDMLVLGTRQNLVSYTNGIGTGAEGANIERISSEHLEKIQKWLPKTEVSDD